MKKSYRQKRYCGDCASHNAYNYPNEIFCGRRLENGEDPVADTLWHCKEWHPSSQECHCVEEALKKRNPR